jgi:hypothetical protein
MLALTTVRLVLRYLGDVAETPLASYILGMKIRIAIVFLAVSAHVCLSQEVPVGWTTPPANMTRQTFRQKAPDRFLVVKGDFNGDGVQDKALLLINQHAQKMGLFVCLTTPRDCEWHRLEVMNISFLDVMGIAKVEPGEYETACGKGYWECGRDKPEKLKTKRDAIEFFKDESASSVYVYNPVTHKFLSIATSD